MKYNLTLKNKISFNNLLNFIEHYAENLQKQNNWCWNVLGKNQVTTRFKVNREFLIKHTLDITKLCSLFSNCFVVVQSLSHVQLFATPWDAAHQASLSFTISQSLRKLMSIESVMPSNHLILCRPLLLPPIFSSMVNSSHQVAKVLELHQSFQRILTVQCLVIHLWFSFSLLPVSPSNLAIKLILKILHTVFNECFQKKQYSPLIKKYELFKKSSLKA